MRKFFRIILYEYSRHVLRKRFIFALLSVPLMIGLLMAISILAAVLSINTTPIGYVDQSGFLAHPVQLPPSTDFFTRRVEIIPYQTEAEAKAALENSAIQAYYVLKPDYLTTADASLVFLKDPDSSIKVQFMDFLQANLLASQPAGIATRITAGTEYTIQSPDGKHSLAGSEWYNILVPLVAGVLFIIVILTSGGYLLRAVVEEKENRTIEIIVTSVSPGQLLAGKIIGNIGVGLTQILAWMIFIGLFVLVGRSHFQWIQQIQISGSYVLLMILALLPAFVMVAALMAAIGSTTTETREAEQISGLFSLPIMVPYILAIPIITNPNSPLSLFLSFFPLTAPVTLTLRAAFTELPLWQEALNLLVLFLCAAGAVWLAARTFRLGMLRYGKRISWRELFSKAG
jgi:ABC-2 type transport system permease protein